MVSCGLGKTDAFDLILRFGLLSMGFASDLLSVTTGVGGRLDSRELISDDCVVGVAGMLVVCTRQEYQKEFKLVRNSTMSCGANSQVAKFYLRSRHNEVRLGIVSHGILLGVLCCLVPEQFPVFFVLGCLF